MEMINVYDANLNLQGTEDRKNAHKLGLWHKTFHCWIVNPNNNSILFQLRSKDKKNYPNMFDISAAGHLLAGEEDKDGIREVAEELGVKIDYNTLYSLGYRVEVDDQSNGQKNREYQAVYIGKVDRDLNDYNPQVEEVAGLMWMSIDDALSLFSGEIPKVFMLGIAYNNNNCSWEEITREVSLADFIPRIQNYYLTISIMAERVIKNQMPISIS